MDFHAVAEAFVDGAWRVVDATCLVPRQTLDRAMSQHRDRVPPLGGLAYHRPANTAARASHRDHATMYLPIAHACAVPNGGQSKSPYAQQHPDQVSVRLVRVIAT
jgi:hypothetical protein